MEFLKAILGEDLFSQVSEKLNAHNGNDANKDAQIKLANLASGEYVGKGKYDALMEQITGKDQEIKSANDLIAELKKSNKGNEDLQSKIGSYEQQVADLQKQLQETRIKSAVKVALMSDHAVDVDYLTYKLNEKLNEKGQTLELDENDSIKGWKDLSEGLKVQFPTMFQSASSGEKKFEEKKLDNGDDRNVMTKESLLKMSYAKRNEFYNENPEAYTEIMNK